MSEEFLQNRLLEISKQAFAPEVDIAANLLNYTEIFRQDLEKIEERASRYINNIRASKKQGGVEEFMQQFSLQEKETVGLLCLAEALLRIPDEETANSLINDKLKQANWRKFLKENSGFSLHAKAFALMISSKITSWEDSSNLINKIVYRLGEPTIRFALKNAMELLGKNFVAGTNMSKALQNTKNERKKGYTFSYDMLGEGARTDKQAEKFFQSYLNALESLKDTSSEENIYLRPNLSIKLSALHPRYNYLQQDRVMTELYARVKALCLKAKEYNLSISIDAEESYRLDSELELFTKLIRDKDFTKFSAIGFVLQAYQKRAIPVIHLLKDLAAATNKRIPIRLVKGAYWDNEIKWAQIDGLEDYPVFTHKSYTDLSYLACTAELFKYSDYFYPQFATHNAHSAAAIITLAERMGKEHVFEFQRLYGMGESFYEQMIAKRPCRVYAPVGSYNELLPYLIRRLMENGANSNFINQLLDPLLDLKALIKDPIAKAQDNLQKKSLRIPLPKDIFSKRANSAGYSLGNRAQIEELKRKRSAFDEKTYQASSIINATEYSSKATKIFSPSNLKELVGTVHLANADILKSALKVTEESNHRWRKLDVETRANCLEKMAILLKEHEIELMSLLAREAGKTLADSIAEIREAIDFCNYYAMQARKIGVPEQNEGYTGEENLLSYHGRGIFACISPWNFPLAIYIGQISAALVAGNSVIAKPAESTSLIAYAATKLFYEAGIPQDVLIFTPALGKLFSREILTSPLISGVAFTGSTGTAMAINQTLANRPGPIAKLIAETGGQNCMLVDSTALLEQACDDIILSSFGSAGQRCSALRVVFMQEEIADNLLELLSGAVAELKIGNPYNFDTDIGPVINKIAQTSLNEHISLMQKEAKLIAKAELPADCNKGYFVAPHIFSIKNIEQLQKENFGPILHCIRYKASELDKIINAINSTGYALTFGIHSRIEERIKYVCKQIRAGNIYINRNITGAIVGTQPFGGMLLSGTGPKAGGPDYLKAFMHEQNISDNTTVIGGNLSLLSTKPKTPQSSENKPESS